jgi:hypothetical protein
VSKDVTAPEWERLADRLRCFAMAYTDHPRRNPDDRMNEVLSEYDRLKALKSQNTELTRPRTRDMKPENESTDKPDALVGVACSDLLGRELENLERIVREYVSVKKCSCPPPGENGVTSLNCWRCCFEYNLNHLDAAKRHNVRVSESGAENPNA